MSELRGYRLAWVFVGLTAIAAAAAFYGGLPVAGAADDHDEAHELRARGDVVPLAVIIGRPELAGLRVLEAEFEHEDGRLIYELEVLDPSGMVSKRYFDAATGEPLAGTRED